MPTVLVADDDPQLRKLIESGTPVITQSSQTLGTLTLGAVSGAKGTLATVYIGAVVPAAKEASEGAATLALKPLPASLDATPPTSEFFTASG